VSDLVVVKEGWGGLLFGNQQAGVGGINGHQRTICPPCGVEVIARVASYPVVFVSDDCRITAMEPSSYAAMISFFPPRMYFFSSDISTSCHNILRIFKNSWENPPFHEFFHEFSRFVGIF